MTYALHVIKDYELKTIEINIKIFAEVCKLFVIIVCYKFIFQLLYILKSLHQKVFPKIKKKISVHYKIKKVEMIVLQYNNIKTISKKK